MFERKGIFSSKPAIEIDKKITKDIANIKEANACLRSFLETHQTDYVEAIKKLGYDLPLKLLKAPSEDKYLQPEKIAEYLSKQKIKTPALIGINENYLYLYMESKEGKLKLIQLNLETLCGYKFTSAILDNLKNEDIEKNKFYYQKQGNTIRYKVKSLTGKVESGEITENDLKVKIEAPVNWTWGFKFKILEKTSLCNHTTSSQYKDVFNKDFNKIRVSLSDKKEIYDLIKFKKEGVYHNLLDNVIADIDQILNESNGLKDIAKYNLEKQTEKEKKLREKIKNCRSIIDEILTALLSVDFDLSVVGSNVDMINNIYFSDMLIQLDQKKSALEEILIAKRKAKSIEKNTELKKIIEVNKQKIFELAQPVLYQYFSKHANFTDELIIDKMIEHFSKLQVAEGNTDYLYYHKIWKRYKDELQNPNTENDHFQSLSGVQEQIISVMIEYNELNPSEKQQINHLQGNIVQLNEIHDWFEDSDFDGILAVNIKDKDNPEKTIENCAISWKKLLDTDVKKAFRILKYMIEVVCCASVVKTDEEIKNPVKNLADFALFLLKIPCLSQIKTKEEKIKKCIIHHMGYKVYDLISAHFILEEKSNINLSSRNKKPPGRENGIVFGIITILVKNTDFEKFIISCIQPVFDVMNSKKVNISKGCHFFLKSSNNTPTIENLTACDIKIRITQPSLYDYMANSSVEQSKAHSQKSIYVFVQPNAGEPPTEIYFVDRRGTTPVIIPLNFPEDIAALTVMLFPLGKNNMCYDRTSIETKDIDTIALHTEFYLRDFPAIIKKGKDKYFIHAPLGDGKLQVIQFNIDDPNLLECLNQLNFDSSETIWISPEHYPVLYKAILAQGGKEVMKVYHYIGDVVLLKDAFSTSINMLFETEKYPPDVQRILHDFAKVNKDELLGYILTRFISPVIKFYGSHSTNDTLQFWCQEIIAYTMQALTTSESKRVSYQKRIEQSLLDLIYSMELRTKVNKMCSGVSNIDKRILDFKIRFKEPLTQLAKDAGVFMTAEKHTDTLVLPFDAHIEIFSRKLEQLTKLLEEAKKTQKIKEASLSELEKDEHELMILCFWYQDKFKTAVNLSDITSTIEINRREQAQKQYGLLLMSAFEKIKDIKLDNIDSVNEAWESLENIKNRTEYIDYKQLSEKEQLIAFIREKCNKICNKKIWKPSDGPIISLCQVADIHFERLENLQKDFENFIEEQKKEVPENLEEKNLIAENKLIIQQSDHKEEDNEKNLKPQIKTDDKSNNIQMLNEIIKESTVNKKNITLSNVNGVNTFGLLPLPKQQPPQILNPQLKNMTINDDTVNNKDSGLPKSPNPLNKNGSKK